MPARSRQFDTVFLRYVKSVALVTSLALSAYVIATALKAPSFRWVGCIGFLPLIAAMRSARPRGAALAGGIWGFCLYAFIASAMPAASDPFTPAPGSSTCLLALLVVVPAAYLGFAGSLRDASVCRFVILALGWMVVEAVIQIFSGSGVRHGLLTGYAVDGPQVHLLARLPVCLTVAFVVVVGNASLINLLRGIRHIIFNDVSVEESSCELLRNLQTLPIPIRFLDPDRHPRAPPLPFAATNGQ